MATTRTKLSPEEQMARAKQKALGEGIKVWLLESSPVLRFAIPSSSTPGQAYEVICHDPDTEDVSCNYPGNIHRGICKHQAAVMLRLAVDAEMELARARAAEDRETQAINGSISPDETERIEREIAELYR